MPQIILQIIAQKMGFGFSSLNVDPKSTYYEKEVDIITPDTGKRTNLPRRPPAKTSNQWCQ
jgi:hypothetical protein